VATRSLQRILSVHFGAAATIPVATLGIVVFVFGSPWLELEIEKRNQRMADALRGQAELFLSRPEIALSNFGDLLRFPVTDDHRLVDSLDAVVERSDVFEAVYLVSEEGAVINVGLPLAHRSRRANYLGLDLSRRTFIREALVLGTPSWSDTFLSIVSGKISLAVAVPIDGRVLVGNFNLDHLSGFVRQIQAGRTVLPVIVDRKGNVVAHPDEALSAQHLNIGNLEIVRQALDGRPGTGPFEFGGVEYVGTATRIPGPGWLALVGELRTEAHRELDAFLAAVVVTLIAATGLAVLLALRRGRELAKPILEFSQQAETLAAGRFGVRFRAANVRSANTDRSWREPTTWSPAST
jgi:hypothetical protein